MRTGWRHWSNTSRVAVVLALSVVLHGCYWNQPGFDSRRSGYNPHEGSITSANVATLTEEWSGPGGALEVITTSTGVHAFGGGDLQTYDLDGSLLWSAPVDTGDLFDVPLIGGFRGQLVVPSVEVGDPTGCLLVFDAASGAAAPCVPLPAPSDSTDLVYVQAVRDGAWVGVTYVYQIAGGWESAIAATNLSDPSERWIIELGTDTGLSNPIIVDGVVYVAMGDLSGWTLAGWELAGACTPDCGPPMVEHELPAGIISGISADPSGASIAIASTEGLVVVDRASGDVLWTGSYAFRPYHHNSIPTWTPSALVVPLWRTDGDLDVTTVVSFDVEGCGASLCPPTWSADLPGQPMGQGAAAGDVFYVTSMQSFAAFPTACTAVCAPLYVQDEDVWTWFGSPIVANGLVLHAPGGDLQALSLP